jgi:hypothetical protein
MQLDGLLNEDISSVRVHNTLKSLIGK